VVRGAVREAVFGLVVELDDVRNERLGQQGRDGQGSARLVGLLGWVRFSGCRACCGARAGGEQAGRAQSFAAGGGIGIVGVVAGHDRPAGAGQEFDGLAGLERRPDRLAQRRDRGLEAGSGRGLRAG
jgi:hypothetical protein